MNHVLLVYTVTLTNVWLFYFFRLPDGLTRRGDINLLMLGDPGTAKSQLLKFVERCSPIGVGLPVLCYSLLSDSLNCLRASECSSLLSGVYLR